MMIAFAAAFPVSPSLRLQGDAGCFTAQMLLETVEKATGRTWTELEARGLELAVDLRQRGRGWRLNVSVVVDDRRSERTLEGSSCELALRSAVLLSALAIDEVIATPAIASTSVAIETELASSAVV